IAKIGPSQVMYWVEKTLLLIKSRQIIVMKKASVLRAPQLPLRNRQDRAEPGDVLGGKDLVADKKQADHRDEKGQR
ncbi:hypothetical protein HT105_25315, partial [Bacteroides fragilis]|nr:hypothetical protein [Bacteroides fragilis]